MKICSICHKISATNDDHLDCKEKRKVELEDKENKQGIPEKLDMEKNSNDLNIDIKAILDHVIQDKDSKYKK